MKNIYVSSKANAILKGIRNYDEKDQTRKLVDSIVLEMRELPRANHVAAAEMMTAIAKKNVKDEAVAKKIDSLEDTANFWARRCDELEETLKKMAAEVRALKSTVKAHEMIATTGVTPAVADEGDDLGGTSDDAHVHPAFDDLLRDTNGELLQKDRVYHAKEIATDEVTTFIMVDARGLDVVGFVVHYGATSDQAVCLNDAPSNYVFTRDC